MGHFGLLLYRARRYEESIAYCRKALDIDPQYANALWFTALSQEQTGDLTGAVRALEEDVRISPAPHYRALLGRALALFGETAKARNILGELMTAAARIYISPFDIGVVHDGLSNDDETFRWFEEAMRQRVFRIVELTLPMFDSLRADARWLNLVRHLGLDKF